MKPSVCFYFDRQSFNLQKRQALKEFISAIFKNEGVRLVEIRYVFSSDTELLRINKEFLSHDFLTDIITFDLSEDKKGKIAEVYISIDRIKYNSNLFQVSIKHEIHRVVFHGALHVCGYKDRTRRDKLRMTEKENYYLKRYFLK